MSIEISSVRDTSIYKENIYTSHESLSLQRPKRPVVPKSPLAVARSNSSSEGSYERLRILVTLAMYFFYFCTGMNAASVGTTLVHMGYIYQATIQVY